jgi:hypothetical protein
MNHVTDGVVPSSACQSITMCTFPLYPIKFSIYSKYSQIYYVCCKSKHIVKLGSGNVSKFREKWAKE